MDSSLIFLVRDFLGDVPREYLDDLVINTALEYADAYLERVLPDTVDAEYRKKCQVALAAYYAYLSYVSTIERGLGSIPGTAEFKLRFLKEMALSLIRLESQYEIGDDFSVDSGAGMRPVVIGLTESVINGGDC